MNKIIYAAMALFIIVGCSSKPIVTPALKNAQNAYESIRNDPSISQSAPLALFQAEKIYDLSLKVKDNKEADHAAYLLDREVEVAKQSARKQHLKNQIEKLKSAKQKALLDQKETQLLLLKKEMKQAKEKLKELQELNAKQTNRGLVLTLGDVLFESSKANLLPGSKRAIDKLVEFLNDNPQRKVLIEGHTDNVGSATYNIDLSLRRAQSVKDALVAQGIDENRVTALGYGEMYPVAPNSDAAGRQRNRRVEIVILEKGVDPENMHR